MFKIIFVVTAMTAGGPVDAEVSLPVSFQSVADCRAVGAVLMPLVERGVEALAQTDGSQWEPLGLTKTDPVVPLSLSFRCGPEG